MERLAKIVATLGPSCNDEITLQRIIEAGMDVARLNFSHGTADEHAARIRMIRKLSQKMGKPITILQDLQGPKLRVGNIPGGAMQLNAGDTVILCASEETNKTVESHHHSIRCTGVQPGSS
jgi:pyruvate kinase